MQDPNLKCQQLEDALDAYYDLELSAEEAEAVERHLADCAACTARLAEIDSVVMQVKSVPEVQLSRDLSGDIEAKILALQNKAVEIAPPNNVVPFAPPSKKKYYWLASAAAVFALCLGLTQLKPTPDSATLLTHSKVTPADEQVTDHVRDHAYQKPVLPDHVVATKPVVAPALAIKPHQIPTTATTQMLAASGNSGGTKDHKQDINQNQINDSEELVALYDYDNTDNASDLGISTNEDGLYAIKL